MPPRRAGFTSTTEHAPIAKAWATSAGLSTLSSRQSGVASCAARRACAASSVGCEGLLDAEEVEPVELLQMLGVRFGVGAVGIDLDAERRERGGDRVQGLDVALRCDLHLHPAVPGVHQRADRVDEFSRRFECADDRASFDRAIRDPEHGGERSTLCPEMGVGGRHLQRGKGHR